MLQGVTHACPSELLKKVFVWQLERILFYRKCSPVLKLINWNPGNIHLLDIIRQRPKVNFFVLIRNPVIRAAFHLSVEQFQIPNMMSLLTRPKTFLYLVLFGLFFWQLYEAVKKLESGQLTTKISYATESKLQLPSITICHYQVRNSGQDQPRANKTIMDAIDEANRSPLVTGGMIFNGSTFQEIVEAGKW